MTTEQALERLTQIYQQAENQIINREISNKDFFSEKVKKQVLNQIQRILLGLLPDTNDIIDKFTQQEWTSGVETVDQAIAKIPVKAGFNVVDTRAVEFIDSLKNIQDSAKSEVKAILSNAYHNIQNSLNIVSKQVKNELLTQIATGSITGKSRLKISEELQRTLISKGITGASYVDKNGKQVNLQLSTLSEGLVRNTLTVAGANSVTTRALELNQDLVKVSTHSNCSPMCAMWQGEILSLTGKTEGYPTLGEAQFKGYKKGGLFHRYCRHSLSVYIQTDVKFK